MSELENIIKKKLLELTDSTVVKVRVDDTDFMGVVHFKNYLMYFDDGFVSFITKTCETANKIIEKGIVFPVKKVTVIYENFAKFGDSIKVNTEVKAIGTNSLTFIHELFKNSDNSLLATIECVRLIMELKSKKLLNVAEFFKNYLM